ncbi:MAG: FAD-dependent oxidoreductase [Clostridia bacterium]|nr:FAD-dependent oxidoreductase [Clostridia bacterium]
MIRVKDIKISITAKEQNLKKALAKKLNIFPDEVIDVSVYKKSIDARNKDNIIFTYTLNAKLKDESNFKDLVIEEKDSYPHINKNRKSNFRPVIVGAGPGGLFCGLVLAKEGYNPIIIEMGKDVDERKKDIDTFWSEGKLNPLSNVQFGEGGAGTFSDGKLTTLINNPLCDFVLEEFERNGAPEEILYLAHPHVGTDNLINVIKNIREKIKSLGGEVFFNEKVTDIIYEDDKVTKVVTSNNREIETDTVVLAIGHSSRDTFEVLKDKNLNMIAKPFSVGFRVEHLQSDINKSQYGKYFDHELLKAAEYKLSYHDDENRGTYTFCMCPGGVVVASASEEGRVVTNGMSYYLRDGENANSAVLVSVMPEDFDDNDVLCGMKFQRELEEKAFVLGGSNYNAPVQLVRDYLQNKKSEKLGKVTPSYRPGYTLANLNELFSDRLNKSLHEGIKYFGKRLKGFDDNDGVLTGVETRSSSPVRILRDDNFESNIKGIYPCGEGCGYAGGIMSAAVDGIKVAIAIIEKEN